MAAASSWAALVAAAERPASYSSRDGRLLRLVPANERLSSQELLQHLERLAGGGATDAALLHALRTQLPTDACRISNPGAAQRHVAAWVRGCCYLAAGNARQALQDARTAVAYAPASAPRLAPAAAADPPRQHRHTAAAAPLAAAAATTSSSEDAAACWYPAQLLAGQCCAALGQWAQAALHLARAQAAAPAAATGVADAIAAQLRAAVARLPPDQLLSWHAGGPAGLQQQLQDEADMRLPEVLRPRPKWYYYNAWMQQRIHLALLELHLQLQAAGAADAAAAATASAAALGAAAADGGGGGTQQAALGHHSAQPQRLPGAGAAPVTPRSSSSSSGSGGGGGAPRPGSTSTSSSRGRLLLSLLAAGADEAPAVAAAAAAAGFQPPEPPRTQAAPMMLAPPGAPGAAATPPLPASPEAAAAALSSPRVQQQQQQQQQQHAAAPATQALGWRLPGPVVAKLLAMDAGDLDLLVQHPAGLQAQVYELLDVMQEGGREALEAHAVPPLGWEEVQALAGPGLVGLPLGYTPTAAAAASAATVGGMLAPAGDDGAVVAAAGGGGGGGWRRPGWRRAQYLLAAGAEEEA